MTHKLEERINRRKFIRNATIAAGALTVPSFVYNIYNFFSKGNQEINIGPYGCSSSSSDDPVKEKEMLRSVLNAKYVFSEQNATGTVNFKSTDGTVDKTANIGQQIELIEVNKGSGKSFNITVQGDGALKRIYNNITISGTTTINGVTLLELNGFGLEDFVNHFLDQCDNQNKTWQPSTLTCYIDPSLPQAHKTETENAIKEVVGYSKGAIAAPIFVYEAKPDDDTIPQNTEIWICNSTRFTGVWNAQFPINGDVVTASKMWINLNSASPWRIRGEVFDLFIQENQNFPYNINQYIAKHFEFALKHRPKGNQNNYWIYTDREQQDGFDTNANALYTAGKRITYVQEMYNPLNSIINRNPRYRRIERKEPGHNKTNKKHTQRQKKPDRKK